MPRKVIKKNTDHLAEARIKGLEKARETRQARLDAGLSSQRTPIEKFKDKPTRTNAIHAMCYECCGRENFRNRIKYCQLYDCPLWIFRPYSKNITKEQCEAYVEPDVKQEGPAENEE